MKKVTKMSIIVVLLLIVVMIVFFGQSLYDEILFYQNLRQQSEEERNYGQLEKIYEEIKVPLEQVVKEVKGVFPEGKGVSIIFIYDLLGKGAYSEELIIIYNGEPKNVNESIYMDAFLSKPEFVEAVKAVEEKKIIQDIYIETGEDGKCAVTFWIDPEKTKFIDNNGAPNEIFYSEEINEEFDYEGYGYYAIGDNWFVKISPMMDE